MYYFFVPCTVFCSLRNDTMFLIVWHDTDTVMRDVTQSFVGFAIGIYFFKGEGGGGGDGAGGYLSTP